MEKMKNVVENRPKEKLFFFIICFVAKGLCLHNFFNLLLKAISNLTTHFKLTCNNEYYILHTSYFWYF